MPGEGDITQEELEQLLSSEPPGEESQTTKTTNRDVVIVVYPATVHLTGGGKIVFEDIGSWGYAQLGVYGIGHMEDSEEEITTLIPYSSIQFIVFDFEGYQQKMDEATAKAVETIKQSLGDSEDEGSGD